jgi:YesN/AraC family two-component response regulator
MDGYQLLDKLKTNTATRHIPVITLTARAEQPDKLKALRIGVDDYLTKPFDEEELKARIENLLKHYALRQETAAEIEPDAPSPTISAADQAWLEAFEAYVQKNLSSDLLSISLLTQEFAMSKSTLLRQLKRLTGLTPQKYLIELRLDKARHLLEEGQYQTINKVAREVGYLDARHFSKMFAQRYGKAPSTLRSQ